MSNNMEKHAKCTFTVTGKKYELQEFATCFDCFSSQSEGACLYCLETCHKGHRIGKIETGHFYCDCGEMGLCNKTGKDNLVVKTTPEVLKKTPEAAILTKVEVSKISDVCRSSNLLSTKLSQVFKPETVYSPFSISYLLSMFHLGTTGAVHQELDEFLGQESSGSSSVLCNLYKDLLNCYSGFNNGGIKLANLMVVNENIKINKTYTQMVENLASIKNEDFTKPSEVANLVNEYIEQNTGGLIKNLLNQNMITKDMLVILANTVYFKMPWKTPFDKVNTKKADFTNDITSENTCLEMMNKTSYYSYFEDTVVQKVELEYEDKDYCMGFILPKNDIKNCYSYLGNNSDSEIKHVRLSIPKFTQTKTMDLLPYFKSLGVKEMFNGTQCYSSMFENSSTEASVSTLIHSAVVIVDEVGTEAAAATVMGVRSCCIRPTPISFNANHSFVYYIKHLPTNTLLFVGDYHGN
jgi:serpin B/serpin B11/12